MTRQHRTKWGKKINLKKSQKSFKQNNEGTTTTTTKVWQNFFPPSCPLWMFVFCFKNIILTFSALIFPSAGFYHNTETSQNRLYWMPDVLWTAFWINFFKIWLSIFSQHRSFSDDKSITMQRSPFMGEITMLKVLIGLR